MAAQSLESGSPGRLAARAVTGLIGLGLALLAVALFFQWPVVAGIWPWQGPYAALSPLSFCFLASIAGAIAAPALWIALADKLHAAAPGAMNLSLILAGLGGFMAQGYRADPGNGRLLIGALVCAAGLVGILATLLWGRDLRGADTRPLPRPVYLSFLLFIVTLVTVGILLLRKTPNVIPWAVSEEAMVVYGWIFLGAAVYFIFAVARPLWENAAGQLIGFLVYDLVLIGPFVKHFGDVAPEQFWSLVIYTTVVLFSGFLAVWYLFVDPATRLGAAPQTAARV